ncbi:MAG: SDR family NAD(P)-dependent oxidoreductase, partial [Chelatococcus sp.]
MKGLLDGKTIIITGAGSNVGRAAEHLFLTHGARLALVDRDVSRISTTSDSPSDSRLVIAADLTDAAANERMVGQALAHFGRIDGLCNTFGIDPPTA